MKGLKVNLIDELQNVVKDDEQKIDAIEETKLLLEENSQADKRFMKELFGQSTNVTLQDKHTDLLVLKKLAEEHGGVFTQEQIKAICVKYHLRFLQTKNYKGNINVAALSKMRTFLDGIKTTDNYSYYDDNFYIMAPPNLFSLRDEKYLTKRELDPIVFFKISHGVYKIVANWGNDFTIYRRFLGFKWESFTNKVLVDTVKIMFLMTILFGIIVSLSDSSIIDYSIFSIIYLFYISIGFSCLHNALRYVDDFEIIKEFFTPDNYNSSNNLKR